MTKASSKFPFNEVDDFKLKELIYEGPHTLVFRGHQSNLNRPVLIKLLKPFIEERKEYIERFQREARVCAQFKHPNIVGVYKLGEKNGYHYIALEFVEGISLKELLGNTAPLPFQISLSIADQILEALIYVHQHKIIHRDIKPGNILIDSHGRAKLTDFGLAHLGDEVSVTQQGSIIGTPAYMAPEQIMGGALDGRTDLFSLGTVIYEMFTGKQAFGGESYSACLHKIINEDPAPSSHLNPQLPTVTDSLIQKFLIKNPEERWEDAQQAQENLHALVVNNKIKLERLSTQEFVKPFLSAPLVEEKKSKNVIAQHQQKSRLPKRWKLIAGFTAFITLFLATFLWMGNQETTTPKSATKQENLISAASDSGKTVSQSGRQADSIISPVKNMGTNRESNNKTAEQTLQKESSSQDQAVNFAQDTLLAEHFVNKPSNTEELTNTNIENEAEAQLNIWVEPWAKIMIDDQAVDSQAKQKSVSLAPGKHTLTFLHPNFSPYATQVEIQPGEEKTVRWSFLNNAGFLWIEVRPWAEIYIDNQYRDSTPLENPVALSSGEHFLELKHPQLQSYRDYITIAAQDTLSLQIVLKKK